jgi:DnaJ domain
MTGVVRKSNLNWGASMIDPYKVLGIRATASLQEVENAYRDKLVKHHPDRGGDHWAYEQVQAAYAEIIQNWQTYKEEPERSAEESPAHVSAGPTEWDLAIRRWHFTIVAVFLIACFAVGGVLWLAGILGAAIYVGAGIVMGTMVVVWCFYGMTWLLSVSFSAISRHPAVCAASGGAFISYLYGAGRMLAAGEFIVCILAAGVAITCVYACLCLCLVCVAVIGANVLERTLPAHPHPRWSICDANGVSLKAENGELLRVSTDEIRAMAKNGQITASSKLWREGLLPEYRSADLIDELGDIFARPTIAAIIVRSARQLSVFEVWTLLSDPATEWSTVGKALGAVVFLCVAAALQISWVRFR